MGIRRGARARGLVGVPAFDSAGSTPLICFRGRTCARGEHAAAGARAARGAAEWAFGLPETRPRAARSRAVARGAAERAPRAGGRGRSRPPGDCGDGRWTCQPDRIQRRRLNQGLNAGCVPRALASRLCPASPVEARPRTRSVPIARDLRAVTWMAVTAREPRASVSPAAELVPEAKAPRVALARVSGAAARCCVLGTFFVGISRRGRCGLCCCSAAWPRAYASARRCCALDPP